MAGGLTIAYDDFKEPKLKVDVESKKDGETEQFFAKIQSTSTKDAVHDSYYPGPGLHKRPGMTQTVGDKTFQYYWKIRPKIAQLIKKGEQEHLNDHKRAFELTYGRVEKAINKLADKKIGPAKSAAEDPNQIAESNRTPGPQAVARPRQRRANEDRRNQAHYHRR